MAVAELLEKPAAGPRAEPTVSRRRWPPSLDALFTLLFGAFGWWLGLTQLSDNSFLWHLRTGELILDRGIPHSDPYSFTAPGVHWIAQSWLAELAYGVLFRSPIGAFGIRVLGALATAGIAAFAFRIALRVNHHRVKATLLTFAALAGLTTTWSERPLLLGAFALVVLVSVVELPSSRLGRHPMVVLPVLIWLWGNVHGTWILGFGYLGLHLAGRWLDGAPPWQGRERRLLAGSAVAAALLFLNPYGAGLVLFPFGFLGRSDVMGRLVEWRSPNFSHAQGIVFAAWIGVLLAGFARHRDRLSRRDLVVTIPFVVLGLVALRNVALAPLVTLPVAARAFAGSGPQQDPRRSFGAPLAAALAAMIALATLQAAIQPNFVLNVYPVSAMNAIKQRGLLGQRLVADDAYGGYNIMKYWPQQKVFIDDRYDMYPTRVIKDFFVLTDGTARWREVLDRYRIDVVLWQRKEPLSQLLAESPSWVRIHRDKVNDVYVRRTVPVR